MKIMTFLIAVALAAPAVAQDSSMPASTPAATAAASTTTYPPCSATVTDQCIERGGGGHGHGHHWHKKHK